MDFKKFKQMATDYEDFINLISETSRKYCLLNDIMYNPMSDYNSDWWLEDNIIFDIDEDRVIIKWGEDIGTCGETDYEERSLIIPMEFFDPENMDNERLKAQEKKEKLHKLFKDLQLAKNEYSSSHSKKRTIENKMNDMKIDCKKWNIPFKDDFFKEELEKIQLDISKHSKIVEKIQREIDEIQKS